MGDDRRFTLFARLIGSKIKNKKLRIVDVSGGKGYLQLALREIGFNNVVTYDKRYDRRRIPNINYKYKYFNCKIEEDFDVVVAMHPDEGTDHAILYAVNHDIPAFICPCCVKPSASVFNDHSNFTNWIAHLKLLAKSMDIEEYHLKMNGKSLVLVLRPKK